MREELTNLPRRFSCALVAVLFTVGCSSSSAERESDADPATSPLNAREEAEVDTATDDAICYCESLWLLTSDERQALAMGPLDAAERRFVNGSSSDPLYAQYGSNRPVGPSGRLCRLSASSPRAEIPATRNGVPTAQNGCREGEFAPFDPFTRAGECRFSS